MDTSSLLEIWDEFTTPDSTALPLDKLVALVRKANPFDEDQARQISLGLFQAIGLNPDTDAIEFAQVENLIHGFSRVEDAAEVTGASAEEDILDFAEDFFTLCGSLDDDPSLGIDQVAVALGDFGFSDAGVEAAITTFEAAVEGASSGAFTADAFFAAAETAEVQGILQQITPAGVDTRSAAQLFDQMDIGGTGTLRKEQFKKLVSTHRDDITDASTLNMVIMEMDSILRDRPDDEDGCNSLGRGAFVSAVREGVFADLLFPPPASLAAPRGSGRRASGSFEKRGSFGRGGSGKFKKGDPVDAAVNDILMECTCTPRLELTKIADRKYMMSGERKPLLVALVEGRTSKQVNVRVGGGWQNLRQYIESYDKCRQDPHSLKIKADFKRMMERLRADLELGDVDSSHNSLFTNRPLDTPLHPFLEPLKKNVATIKRNATTAGSFRRGKASAPTQRKVSEGSQCFPAGRGGGNSTEEQGDLNFDPPAFGRSHTAVEYSDQLQEQGLQTQLSEGSQSFPVGRGGGSVL